MFESFLIDSNAFSPLGISNDDIVYSQAPCPPSSTHIRALNYDGGNKVSANNAGCNTKNDTVNYLPQGTGPYLGAIPQRGSCKPPLLTLMKSITHSLNTEGAQSPLIFRPADNANSSLLGPTKSTASLECLNRCVNTSANHLKPCTSLSTGLVFDSLDYPLLVKCANTSDGRGRPDSYQRRSQVAATVKGGSNSGAARLRSDRDGKQVNTKFSMEEDFPALPNMKNSTKTTTANECGGDYDAAANDTPSKSCNPSTTVTTKTTASSPSCSVSKSNSSSQQIAATSNQATNESKISNQMNNAQSGSKSTEAGDSTHSIELLDNDRITGIP
ncbi:unnamed protein product, partial [Taenia asiatica]|uniref:Apple domain-containing protein n=1 Tax=Taenia asiatica TaxID=60517 RepID=A0A158R752_TAEAS